MKFYTDVHIHVAAVRQLKLRGVDIIHCGEVGMSDAKDDKHLEYATQQERIMVTCDKGYEIMHYEWMTQEREHAGIVYLNMEDECKDIGSIVGHIMFLVEAADYQTDLYNKFWRATS